MNLIVISMGGYNISERKEMVLTCIGLALTCIFVAEASVKIVVLGSRGYFRSRYVGILFVKHNSLGITFTHNAHWINTNLGAA